MSKRDDLLYFGDMLDAARRGHSKVATKSREDFMADRDTQDIVIRMIQIVGEAARRVPESTRLKHSEIDWPAIIGMRHKVVHDYFKIDFDVVWDTATESLPPLIAALEKVTPPEPP